MQDKKQSNIPPLRFAGFTEEWEEKKLGVIGFFKSNGVDKTIKEGDAFINLLNYMDVFNQKTITATNCSSLMQVTANERQIKENNILKGDVFFTPSSETPEDIGHVSVIEEDLPNTCYSYHLMRYRPNEGVFSTVFPQYAFSSEGMRSQLVFEAQGVQRFVLSKESFENLVCSLPSIGEQEQIGTFFRALDELIGAKEEELEKLRQMKAALLEAMFPNRKNKINANGGGYKYVDVKRLPGDLYLSDGSSDTPRLRFRGFTEPWKRKKLGEIGVTYTGLSGKSKQDFGHGNATFITYLNVYANPLANKLGVDKVEIDQSQNEVKSGDILFTTSSETPEEVGMSSVWLYDTPNTYLNSFCFGYRPSININPYFSASLFRSPGVREDFKLLAQGISRFNISKQKAMELEVSLPSLGEQDRIGEFFRSQDEGIVAAGEQIERLKAMKQACLERMFA